MASCFTARCRNMFRSYPRSTGCHRQSGGLDVLRGVVVPVVDRPACTAGPLPHVQGLGPVLDPAGGAHLTRGLEPSDHDKRPAITCRLVFEHGHERGPARVMHALAQPGTRQRLDRQILHHDRLILTDQRGGELVVELAACVSHFGLGAGDLQAGLGPVPGSLLPAGQLPLGPLQFLLRATQEPRRVDLRAVGQDSEVSQAQVDANGTLRVRLAEVGPVLLRGGFAQVGAVSADDTFNRRWSGPRTGRPTSGCCRPPTDPLTTSAAINAIVGK